MAVSGRGGEVDGDLPERLRCARIVNDDALASTGHGGYALIDPKLRAAP